MRYLIVPKTGMPFYTDWCDEEKFPEDGGVAFDLINRKQTYDGKDWSFTDVDHL